MFFEMIIDIIQQALSESIPREDGQGSLPAHKQQFRNAVSLPRLKSFQYNQGHIHLRTPTQPLSSAVSATSCTPSREIHQQTHTRQYNTPSRHIQISNNSHPYSA